MRPSVSYSINPAFDKYYETAEVVNADGLTQADIDLLRNDPSLQYSRFEDGLFEVFLGFRQDESLLENQRIRDSFSLILRTQMDFASQDQ